VSTATVRLPKSAAAWNTPDFETVFREELAALGNAQLPLQQGLAHSSHATDTPPQVMLIGTKEDDDGIRVRAGLFYTGIIAGCSCADDPTPVDEQAEYCVVEVVLDLASGTAMIGLAQD
jgi:hypothetical protein